MTAYLHAGTVLRVNLSTGEIARERVDPYVERFIGSKGINLKILFDGMDPGIGPFDPGNLLLFGAGPLVGTPFPGACRTDIMARSPISNGLGDSSMGGYFAAELKFAGYDHLVVTGKADKPVYLSINNGDVEICDAAGVWGRDTYDTPSIIRSDIQEPNSQVVCIGPAGERRVVYASIATPNGSTAARSGLGAVMGSKNLKAVAVRGTKGVRVAQPQVLIEECKRVRQIIERHPVYNTIRHETSKNHDREWRMFANLRGGWLPGADAVSEEDFSRKYLLKKSGCAACPVACFDSYDIAGTGSGTIKCSPYGDLTWGTRNPDHMLMLKAHFDCQRYGLDTRSVSAVIGWLMELYHNQIIGVQDTDGIRLEYGSSEAILALPRKISYREGIGDMLADGLPAAAAAIGRGAGDYLSLAKGSPIDINLPATKSRGLAYALAATGEGSQSQAYILDILAGLYLQHGDSVTFEKALERQKDRAEKELGVRDAPDPATIVGKAALLRHGDQHAAICDITGVCSWMTPFVGMPVDADMISRAMSAGLGTEVTAKALAEAAVRLRHVERAFGVLCGFRRSDDAVSRGFYRQLNDRARELGFNEAELEEMKDSYYQLMGWDATTGIPGEKTLEGSGLADVAERLKSAV